MKANPDADTEGAGRSGAGEDLARRLEVLLGAVATGIVEADLEGRFTYANASALRILRATEAELIGRTSAEAGIERYDQSGAPILDPSSPLLSAARDGNDAACEVIRCVRTPTLDIWIDSQAVRLRSPAGDVIGTVVSFVDVSERLRLEAAARASFGRMTDALRVMAAGVVVVDANGRIEYANPAAAATSGLKPEDVVGQLVADPAWQLTDNTGTVLPYDALPVPTALRERREVRGVELGVPTLAGVVRWMRVSAQPLFYPDGSLRGAVVTTEDVTERHKLAEQLLQAQKIEGIGQLAGGIAHDFNNLLTVIIGNSELSLAKAPENTQIREVLDAANRGAALTRQMLIFARKQVIQSRPTYLDQLVVSVDGIVRRVLGEAIAMNRKSESDLWPVRVDPSQLEQVLLNMAINARDAMPHGGSLAIETRNTTVDAQLAQAYPDVQPGDFVSLAISDEGSGIPHDVVGRIFDPFFTTKPIGRGTGIGLSTCHSVVKQTGGFITVDTEVGSGTTFSIYLPRCTAEAAAQVAQPETPLLPGRETILVVEDQEPVRLMVARALRGYGYEVICASDGRHALDVHQRMTKPLDLLLTDVVMPVMDGPELARCLQQRVPGLPVLYMTGFWDARSTPLPGAGAEDDILLKPFTPMQLLARVQKILSRSAGIGLERAT